MRTLQHLLNFHGAELSPDGVFGDQTAAAVSVFQQARGLGGAGSVDAATWEALIVDLQLGASGDAVRAAQTQLYIRGTLPEVDGVYSMKMNVGVRRFQMLKQLEPDGIINRATWLEMLGDTNLPQASADLSRDGFDWQARLRAMLRPEG